jgi:bifunctional non-homologous end joining protein LigD
MSLIEYQRKRHFGKTREPAPAAPRGRGRVKRAIFVVQLHHASRRHYDFRLQVGETLKSWAVPKGPSFDPKVKRMAVEVEDHPVDYAEFEGEIPKGQYGGGHVALFDRGVWSTDGDVEAQLAKGHLRFELFGDKLRGGWHLVRSGKAAKQPQWLLFKEDDAFAGQLEADQLLDGVTPVPGAKKGPSRKAKKAPAGAKAAALPLPARSAGKSRRKRAVDWATAALALPQARKGKLAAAPFAPQLAVLGSKPPEGDAWIHELKWDGYRLVATIVDGRAQLWSRNALPWTAKVPEIAAALERLGVRSAALDGELIAGTGTQQDFNLLQSVLSGEAPAPLTYVLFDLLHVDGIAIDKAPLLARKALLEDLLRSPPAHVAYSSHIPGDGATAFALASERRFEGLISKRADRPYHPGRSDDWRKTKKLDAEEFAVVGYTPPKASRLGFGSLLLARHDATRGWTYAGRVGSGFTNALITDLRRRIGKDGTPTPTVAIPPDQAKELRGALWFAPKFVVEAYLRGIGNSGVLRQPSLKAVRLDKDVADLVQRKGKAKRASSSRSRPETEPSPLPPLRAPAVAQARSSAREPVARKQASSPRGERGNAGAEPATRLTNPAKVIYPERGFTKQQVADYYAAVMDRLLPEIVDRPLSIIRCPSGADRPCFFQKHHTAGLERVDLVRLKEESGNNANYLVVRDAAGVMELVQFNALEFHPWGAKAERPDLCDRVVFDLDPAEDVAWTEVKAAAVHLRKLLAQLELESFLRTSGGKGLHVVVPLNPGCAWPLVKRFTQGFAEALSASEPLRFVATATKKLRGGRIFVDWLRNARGATSVASYSLRARPTAAVALPLAWSELAKLARPDAFTLDTVPARLRRQRKDPWDGIEKVKQDLGRWA